LASIGSVHRGTLDGRGVQEKTDDELPLWTGIALAVLRSDLARAARVVYSDSWWHKAGEEPDVLFLP
jgi:hypothetical protein